MIRPFRIIHHILFAVSGAIIFYLLGYYLYEAIVCDGACYAEEGLGIWLIMPLAPSIGICLGVIFSIILLRFLNSPWTMVLGLALCTLALGIFCFLGVYPQFIAGLLCLLFPAAFSLLGLLIVSQLLDEQLFPSAATNGPHE